MTDGGRTLERALGLLDQHINLERAPGSRPAAPTLERIERLCSLMGEPQHAYPVIHVTGTNGKGSTSRIITSLLQASGLSVGTYTSPHLELLHERLAWNGSPISDEALADVLGAVLDLEVLAGVRASYFEVLTAAALRWFADIAVDVAVVEVGLLGRWDATNVCDGQVAVITNIGVDHTEYAGADRADIAREKAGIIKPASTVILGEDDPELEPIFTEPPSASLWQRGEDFGCDRNHVAVGGRVVDLRTPSGTVSDVFLPLHGAHQGDNAAVALAAAEAFFGRALDEAVVNEGLADVRVPGRFEIVGRQPLVVLDGAHNADGGRALAATVEQDFSAGGRVLLVVGMTQGRDPVDMLQALGAGHARLVVACAPDWPRAVPVDEVAAAARATGAETEQAPSVEEAVRRAVAVAGPEDVVVVTGSLYVVGEARAARARLGLH